MFSITKTNFQLMNFFIDILLNFVIFVIILTYLSSYEYVIHRFPMHMKNLGKPWYLPLFRFLYKNHTEEHHPDFLPVTYERLDTNHHDITLLKPLFLLGFILITTATIPIWLIDYFTNYRFHLIYFGLPMAIVYYILFESIHVSMHKPDSIPRKLFGWTRWFRFLQDHHKIHHSKWGVNFNLVCPIADYLFGTLYKK